MRPVKRALRVKEQKIGKKRKRKRTWLLSGGQTKNWKWSTARRGTTDIPQSERTKEGHKGGKKE